MTERRTLRSTDTLRRHLLTGASVAVIALASAAVVAPTGAWAQVELQGPADDATDITVNGSNIENDTIENTAGAGNPVDHGSIDTDLNTNDAEIGTVTITEDATLYVFDGGTGAPGNLTFTDSILIGSDDTFTIELGTADDGTQSAEAIGTVAFDGGNINGGSDTRGGTLTLSSIQDATNQAAFDVRFFDDSTQSMLLTTLNVSGADGEAAGAASLAGSAMNVTLGDGQDDSVDVTTATFSGGNATDDVGANGGEDGGGTTSTITADTTIANLNVEGGDGGDNIGTVAAATGGNAALTINDTDGATLGAVRVVGGAGGDDDAGGDETGGTGGSATLTLQGTSNTATSLLVEGGDVTGLSNDAGVGGAATVNVDGDLAVSGNITITDTGGAAGNNEGDAEIIVATGVTLSTQGDVAGTNGVVTLNGTGAFEFNNSTGTQASSGVAFEGANAGEGAILFSGTNQLVTFTGGTIGLGTEIGALNFTNGADATFQNGVTVDVADMAIGAGSVATFSDATTVSGNVTGTGQIIVDDGDTVTFDGGAQQNVSAAILPATTDDGTVVVNNTGVGIAFTGTIGSSTQRLNELTLTDGDLIEFDADIVVGALTTGANAMTVQFDGNVDATQITPNDLGVLDFNGNLTIGAGNLTVGAGDASFAGNIDGDGTVIVNNNDDITFDGTALQNLDAEITAGADGEGDVTIANTSDAGVEFNTTIGARAGNAVGTITLNADANATFNALVDADALITGNGFGLTINADGTAPLVDLDDGPSTLDSGDINLGAFVGNGDTVFQLEDAGDDIAFAAVDDEVVVNLSSNFTTGALTFIDDNADVVAVFDQFAVNDTALTDFTLVDDTDDYDITAERRSNADIAAALNISSEQAAALANAVDAAAETFAADQTDANEDLVDAFTSVLNATDTPDSLFSTSAQTAAQTVGTQSSTLGGASQTAFTAFGDIFSLIAKSGGGFGGFNLFNGFGGGDLIVSGPGYSAPAMPSRNGSVWGMGFGGIANADGDTNFEGYDANYGGVVIGVDGAITEDFTIGAFGTYFMSTVDGDGAANAEIEADTFGFGAYASYDGPDFYLDAFAAYGLSDNELTRTGIVGVTTQTLTADYDASQFSIGAAAGVPIEVSTGVYITPNASLTWNHYDADSYTETGGSLAQTVNPDAVSQLTGTIGARIHAVYDNFDNDGTVFIPELRLALIGDLVDDDAAASVAFTGGGATYQVTGTDTDNIGALVGIGFGLDNPDWSAALNYDADIRGDFMSHTARAEFRWKF